MLSLGFARRIQAVSKPTFNNPYRPGAGHMPPFLAGRNAEEQEFRRLLAQDTVLENMVLTGLRGVGKTVLLERLKSIAIEQGWLWVGTDLSESSSLTEERLAIRVLTDLSVVTASIVSEIIEAPLLGFHEPIAVRRTEKKLEYSALARLYGSTAGLAADKLKAVLLHVWEFVAKSEARGIIFAYDEAQNLADHAAKEEFPLSLLLETFQSLQRTDVRFMLALVGLPTLFPKLVESRTYSERMFHVMFLDRLDDAASRDAISRPVDSCPIKFDESSIRTIIEVSGGYPYFIQFICREVYDIWNQPAEAGNRMPPVPMDGIIRKLDSDFFAGRWGRATDRQRDLLQVIAQLPRANLEFTVQEITEKSREILDKPFSPSHANQMLVALGNAGLVYKNRHGRYAFAVPLLGAFILRQMQETD